MRNFKSLLATIPIVAVLAFGLARASEKDEHKDESAEAHGEEGSAAVGPDKGITAKGPLGFQLSPEARAKFAFKTAAYNGTSIACEAIVSVKDGKYVFRVREGWIKKISVQVVSKGKDACAIRADGLQSGDEIVTSRTGFLRIAEVILEEGASHSH